MDGGRQDDPTSKFVSESLDGVTVRSTVPDRPRYKVVQDKDGQTYAQGVRLQTEKVERASRRLQAFEVKEIEIQTEGAGEGLSEVAVDEQQLATFLREVVPLMEQELQLAWRSLPVFDAYVPLWDDVAETCEMTHQVWKEGLVDLQVTSVAWNSTGASLACAFGKLDTLGWCEVTAPVCVWNIFRPQLVAGEPDTVLQVQGFVMCIAFHPTKPSILAGGTYNGELQIWNTGSGELDPLVASSSIDDYLHRELSAAACPRTAPLLGARGSDRGARVAAPRSCASCGTGTARLSADAKLESSAEVAERRRLQELVSKWRADDAEAWASLALTATLYVGSLAVLHLSGGHWAAIILLAFALVRAFIVFHDAAHSSFFEKPDHNKTLGQVLQFFINYSLDEWNTVHNSHHAHFGDVTVKDSSLTIWFSEKELENAPWYLWLAHRIIRDPIFFYPLAGLFVWGAQTQGTGVWYFLGMQTLCAYFLAAWLGGSLGVACFHLQHHCNSPTHLDAAIVGSTRIPLAWPLSVFSFGIEYHHIHHFDIRVPGYRLERCDAEGEAAGLWTRVNTVDWVRAIKSLCHSQFDGSSKASDAGGTPRFSSFWPYSALGLQD
eukprot:s402_g19.t1